MSEIRKFKTESKRLLDLMINSIYTNREIFLRELISNASDAIDKYHYLSLTDDKLEKNKEYEILIIPDKDNRTITISDNGIGMTYDELNESLGTIAKSGSQEFIQKISNNNDEIDINIIGQFGVGFYSAFMVAKKVIVETRSPYSDKGYSFISEGEETYEINEIEKDDVGTKITLYLRSNTEDVDYDEFLEEYKIRRLVKKYSDYIRYPIKMLVSENEYDDAGNVVRTNKVWHTLNSMIPIWKKSKNEVSDEELNEFYKKKFFDYQDPLVSIYLNVEGQLTYSALIFIPKKPPFNLYSERYEKGLELYSKGVFIMEKCKELVPDYLRFIRGLVDSSDLPLNISREMLQHTKDIEKIANNLEKKVLSRLENMLKNEREKYIEFFENYGVNIKFGVYDQFGAKRDLLKDLLIFKTTNCDHYVTLAEYVEKMPENQQYIYYAQGKNKQTVLAMPQMDLIKKQGFDVLVLTDDVDEFALNMLEKYQDKPFKNITQGELDLLDQEEKEHIAKLEEEKKNLISKLKEILTGKIDDVKLSRRLVDSPVCLVSGEGVSLEMEKVISSLPHNEKVTATKILEINPNHELFKALETVYQNSPDELEMYADVLYSQALLMEGFTLENPMDFANKLSKLIIKSTK